MPSARYAPNTSPCIVRTARIEAPLPPVCLYNELSEKPCAWVAYSWRHPLIGYGGSADARWAMTGSLRMHDCRGCAMAPGRVPRIPGGA
eukprot:scaffold3187_cov61-Phaeocystis_antarctica.AAC.4